MIFGRVPTSLARRLKGAAFELSAWKVTQQDILEVLLWRYIDHEDPASLKALRGLLDEYRRARGGEGQSRGGVGEDPTPSPRAQPR